MKKTSREKIERLYLKWWGNSCATVAAFAVEHNLTIDQATRIINTGSKLNWRRGL